MGRTPRPPSPLKYDNMGASDPGRRCPDRSRCVANLPRHTQRGGTGQQVSHHGPCDDTHQLLGERETGSVAESANSNPRRVRTWMQGATAPQHPPNRSAVSLTRHPEAFRKRKERCARSSAHSKILEEQSHATLDNPHRGAAPGSARYDVLERAGSVARKRNRPRPRSTSTSVKPAASSRPAKVSGSTGV